MAPSRFLHRACNALLLLIACFTLPITTVLVWFNYAAVILVEQRRRVFSKPRKLSRRTILITGASSAHGLDVARGFYKDGHRVIAVEIGNGGLLSIARRSRAISKYYKVPQLSTAQDVSYTARCLFIVAKNERADLWIDCSQDIGLEAITSAQQQIREGTRCACIAPTYESVQLLRSKEALLDFLRGRQLPAPQLYRVKSRGEIHNVLNRNRGKQQFLLTSPTDEKMRKMQRVLPRRTISETYQEISTIKIEPNSQMILEEYFDSSNTYQCSVIVVQGLVKLFSARQRTGQINTYFDEDCALWKALRTHTDAIARELGHAFTGHLALLFLLNEKITNEGVVQQILPIEGSLHIDPHFVFPHARHASSELVSAYLAALPHPANGAPSTVKQADMPTITDRKPGQTTRQRFFLSEDVENLAFRPCMQLLVWKATPARVAGSLLTLAQRLLFWDEAYYDFYDPLPAYWRYTIVLAWEVVTGA